MILHVIAKGMLYRSLRVESGCPRVIVAAEENRERFVDAALYLARKGIANPEMRVNHIPLAVTPTQLIQRLFSFAYFARNRAVPEISLWDITGPLR